jgi:hypothetical protein
MSVVINGTTGITSPSPFVLEGSTSGTVTVAAPAVAGTNTQTLVAATGTLTPIISGTVVASTSGTSIDFTSIPSWVKRITVMINGLSTNGTSDPLIQLGDSGGIENTGYVAGAAVITSGAAGFSSTAGFPISGSWSASVLFSGIVTLALQDAATNTWTASVAGGRTDASGAFSGGGYKALSATLDRIRLTTAGGVNTFDAGSINILYE